MNFLEKYDNFCIDLDGVMWNGHIAIPGSVDAINHLIKTQKNVFFITNNAALTREELQTKFIAMGFQADVQNLYTTGTAITKFLSKKYPNAKKIALMGMPGLRKCLTEAGYNIIYPAEMGKSLKTVEDFSSFDVESDIDAVVIAYDVNFDYYAALYCSACLQNGAAFIGLNADRFFIFGKMRIPASGCSLRFLETATGKQAEIIGKPLSFMFELIAEEHGLDLTKTVMIGDSMESDIMMGINSGIDTILVLSGVTSRDGIEKYEHRPSYVMECLGDLLG
jgi:phosphoglycolate/pyridoxal phosphate phosphatase family enzyme